MLIISRPNTGLRHHGCAAVSTELAIDRASRVGVVDEELWLAGRKGQGRLGHIDIGQESRACVVGAVAEEGLSVAISLNK